MRSSVSRLLALLVCVSAFITYQTDVIALAPESVFSRKTVLNRIIESVKWNALHVQVFIDYWLAIRSEVNPHGRDFVVAYGAAGADISTLFLPQILRRPIF